MTRRLDAPWLREGPLPRLLAVLDGDGEETRVVGVALDTMKQLEAQLMMRNYEGFLK